MYHLWCRFTPATKPENVLSRFQKLQIIRISDLPKKRVVGNNMGHDKIEIESSKNYGNDLVKINV